MTETVARKPLRLWPGVVIVALQFIALYVPSYFEPVSAVMFYGMMASFTLGTLLLFIWWLFLSRARWSDRLGGLALLIVVHVVTVLLADPSAKMATMLPGIPWLCAVFVASLFVGQRKVTIIAVLVASLGWTLVRTDGVTGSMDADFAWRWSKTAEEKFLASDARLSSATTQRPVRVIARHIWLRSTECGRS